MSDNRTKSAMRKLLDVIAKPVGQSWTCAGCEQTFPARARAFKTTMNEGKSEFYCMWCMQQN
jgi:hypothetical protein